MLINIILYETHPRSNSTHTEEQKEDMELYRKPFILCSHSYLSSSCSSSSGRSLNHSYKNSTVAAAFAI